MPSVDQRFAELAGEPLPLPAAGRTLRRWQRLAEVAAEDLALVKLYESHTDALAILAELGAEPGAELGAEPGVESAGSSRWAVWGAEPPQARLDMARDGDRLLLTGRKAWCSGARLVSHALVTGWDSDGRPQLAAVRLGQPGITVQDTVWQAPGMSRVDTPDLTFDRVPATAVGPPSGYLDRPGFWHGGCGIAACWYGGTLPLARAVLAGARRRDEPHALAHLGAIDLALESLRALLIQTAGWLDGHPQEPAPEQAWRLRGSADTTARLVLDHAGRALGAGPLCRDPAVARHFADLPIFIRQCHAERDLAALGASLADRPNSEQGWQL